MTEDLSTPAPSRSDNLTPFDSAIYEGHVRHRRFEPRRHDLRMPLYMMYLDLSELTSVFRERWFWSTRRFNIAWFRRADYLGDAADDLGAAVRDCVEHRLGRRPSGPIRLLTHLRQFGYAFNPVSFYYCFEPEGRRVDALVAEITNTPWQERHRYVLDARSHGGLSVRQPFEFDKEFHVSPFMPMDQVYRWRFSEPGDRMLVHMENLEMGHGESTPRNASAVRRVFDATLSLRRTAISGASLARVLVQYPAMTLGVIAGIYWNAMILKFKHIPFHSHPRAASPRPGDAPPGPC